MNKRKADSLNDDENEMGSEKTPRPDKARKILENECSTATSEITDAEVEGGDRLPKEETSIRVIEDNDNSVVDYDTEEKEKEKEKEEKKEKGKEREAKEDNEIRNEKRTEDEEEEEDDEEDDEEDGYEIDQIESEEDEGFSTKEQDWQKHRKWLEGVLNYVIPPKTIYSTIGKVPSLQSIAITVLGQQLKKTYGELLPLLQTELNRMHGIEIEATHCQGTEVMFMTICNKTQPVCKRVLPWDKMQEKYVRHFELEDRYERDVENPQRFSAVEVITDFVYERNDDVSREGGKTIPPFSIIQYSVTKEWWFNLHEQFFCACGPTIIIAHLMRPLSPSAFKKHVDKILEAIYPF